MILDFNNLSNHQKLQIDEISSKIENDYNILIENILKTNKNNNDIFFSNIISRNNDENQIFYSLCLLELSLKLSKEGKLSRIITSSDEQTYVLKQKIKSVNIITKKKINTKFFLNILKVLKNIHYLAKLVFCRSSKRKENTKNLKKIVLLELFFIPKMFSNNTYKDRYYGNLLDKLSKNENRNYVFFPIFFHKAIKNSFIKLAEKKINLLLQSDYLKFSDYIKSISYFLRIKKIKLNNLLFRGFNIESLIKKELEIDKFNQSSLIAQLNYYCFRRMKDEKLDIELVIDWYENQIVDKGFNYGKNIFFPNIKSKGFIGLNSILEINKNFIPSKLEIEKKLAPTEICLTSPKYFDVISKKRKDINVSLAPALRSGGLFNDDIFKEKQNNKSLKILINFTGFYQDNLEMISLINKSEILRSEKIDLFIRPHQVSNTEVLINLISKKLKYHLSIKNFYEEMHDTDILISRSSTACFESLVFGVPVLVTRRKNGFLPDKIYETFPKNLWFFSNDSEDLQKNISRIMVDKTKYIVKSVEERKKLLSEYFYPINQKNVSTFLK